MRKFKDLSLNEKLMISFILILLIAVVLNWSNIYKGIKKGFDIHTEQPAK
ncbi:hypothetical protein [Ancylomarina euxinus]|nr:hypothetical protein [Ancylomarina euxinus]MCZ4694248.1 hypothetical protein [Ancylomarina euxinus]MUP14421.1 hypothetical protein [Ancylomarina euxinus]